MRKLSFVWTLLCLLLTAVPSFASIAGDKFTKDGITYVVVTVPTTSNPGTLSIYSTSKTGAITFPAAVVDSTGANFKVTELSYECFQSKSGVTEITFPATLVKIPKDAFSASSVTKVNIPAATTLIELEAFRGAKSLTSINVDASNTAYKSVDGVLYTGDQQTLLAYPAAKAGTSFTAPSTTKTISSNAFYECKNLTTVNTGGAITCEPTAFNNCKALTTINLSASTTTFASAVGNCPKITNYNVASGNPTYASDNGVLFNTSKTTLINYPVGRSNTTYTIPSSVTRIGSRAFYPAKNLTSINIPSTVKNIEYYAFANCSKLKTLTFEEGVQEIEWCAFEGCDGLKTVELPASLKQMGTNIFNNCAELRDITVRAGNTKYVADRGVLYTIDKKKLICFPTGRRATDTNANSPYYTDYVNGYTIPSGVEKLGECAFFNARLEQTVTIPTSMKAIDNSAFYYAFPTGIIFAATSQTESIGQNAFSKLRNVTSLDIPASVKTISENAIRSNEKLQSITIADGSQLTSVGRKAFSDNPLLTTVTIGNNCALGELGTNAFSDNPKLATVNIGANSLDKIGRNAFQNNPELTAVNFAAPAKVTTISEGAFQNCKKLPAITIPNTVTTIDASAFNGASKLASVTFEATSAVKTIGRNAFQNTALSTITLPESLTRIDKEAFHSCHNITAVKIPAAVTSLSSQAFIFCSSLKAINVDASNTKYSSIDGMLMDKNHTKLLAFPPGLSSSTYTRIPSLTTAIDSAFYSCYALDNVTIPRNVTTIGDYAFSNCKKLKSLSFTGNVPTLNNNAFLNTKKSDITIFVRKRWKDDASNAATVATMQSNFKAVKPSFYTAAPSLDRGIEYFPTSVTAAGVISFEDYSGLSEERTTVIVPAKVTNTEDNVTYSVTTVLDYAFENKATTGKIWSATFLGDIEAVGIEAFTRSSLKEIFFAGSTVPSLSPEEYALVNAKLLPNSGVKLYTKPSLQSAFNTAWGTYLNSNTIEIDIPAQTNATYAAVARPFRTLYSGTGAKPYRVYEYLERGGVEFLLHAVSIDALEVPAELPIVLYSPGVAQATTTYQIAEDQSTLTLGSVPSAALTGDDITSVKDVFYPTLEDTKPADFKGSSAVYYGLTKLGYFAKIDMTSSNALRPWIGYLALPASVANARKISFLFDDGITTAIEHVALPQGNSQQGETMYNLNGVKTNAPTKGGLYIQGGKKVFVQ